jgi:hypothetical protein
MIIEGDVRHFIVINTVEYNNDGRWCATPCALAELENLGFDFDDVGRIQELGIGDSLRDFDFHGVIVIRVA